ncbi:MAG: maleylacetoacetate isomerase [Halieaceae bacterium]
MKLYSYWRSSAAYRVRIALNLKGLDYQTVPVNLLKQEHKAPDYLDRNAAGLVPTLELDDGRCLTQSTAIIQWLDAEYPEPALLPTDNFERARVLSMANTVACEIHPLNNMGVLNYLKAEYDADQEQLNQWMYHWLDRGFSTLESEISAAPYCCGEQLTMADLLLVPMVYNALRFNYDLASRQAKVYAVWQACNEQQAFIDAQPENQPDAT